MSIVHFLNVGNGDCNIIQHNSGRISVIDICKGEKLEKVAKSFDLTESKLIEKAMKGNFKMKDKPENPINYLKKISTEKIHRFILTHPDMDHLDGFCNLLREFNLLNFWDTDNKEEKVFNDTSNYNEDDWLVYKYLRDNEIEEGPKRLVLYSESNGKYYNIDEENNKGGDGLYVLSPTMDLINDANKNDDYNDCSYVILYHSTAGKILFAGDSHDKTWEHIINKHKSFVSNIDVLIAPHHGRDSGRDHSFLNTLKPKLTLFGNAPHEHLSKSWSNRGLEVIRNNQAGTIILEIQLESIHIHVTNESFAKKYKADTFFDKNLCAWYIKSI
jgi:competence protein ComEC